MLGPHRKSFVSFQHLDALQQGQFVGPVRALRKSARRTVLLQSLFLPVVWTVNLPIPNYPGSRYKAGESIVGMIVSVCVVLGVVAAVLTWWDVVVACLYWFVGAKLLQREFRQRGRDV